MALLQIVAVHAQSADLVAKAKAEGKLSLYTVWDTALAQKIADGFTAKYGISVEIFRAGGAQIGQKVSLELRSQQVQADVLEINEPTLPMLLAKQGALGSYKILATEGLELPLVAADDTWHSVALLFVGLIYNKDKVKPEEAPKSYKDLADPKWAGKLVLASPNYGSVQLAQTGAFVEIGGWELIEALAKNKTMIIRAFPESENAVASGERLVGTDSSNRAAVALSKGAPLSLIYPDEGVIGIPAEVMVMKEAPHPNAGRLYLEYVFSPEVQKLFASAGVYPARKDAGSPAQLKPYAELKIYKLNWERLLENRTETVRKWTELMER